MAKADLNARITFCGAKLLCRQYAKVDPYDDFQVQIMSSEVVTKTIWQFSEKLDSETIAFQRGIASDHSKVKNYAYDRYSGKKHR